MYDKSLDCSNFFVSLHIINVDADEDVDDDSIEINKKQIII